MFWANTSSKQWCLMTYVPPPRHSQACQRCKKPNCLEPNLDLDTSHLQPLSHPPTNSKYVCFEEKRCNFQQKTKLWWRSFDEGHWSAWMGWRLELEKLLLFWMRAGHGNMLATRLPNKISKDAHQQHECFCSKTQCFFKEKGFIPCTHVQSIWIDKNQCFRHRRKFIPCTHVQRGARHSVHTRSYEGPVAPALMFFIRLNFRSLICSQNSFWRAFFCSIQSS